MRSVKVIYHNPTLPHLIFSPRQIRLSAERGGIILLKLLGLSFSDLIGESTLRQAQGDICHGELVRPGESAEEDRTMDCPVKPDNDDFLKYLLAGVLRGELFNSTSSKTTKIFT